MALIRPFKAVRPRPETANRLEMVPENVHDLLINGMLIEEESPSVYIYQMIEGKHVQVGLAACCSIDEYEQGRILRHERTCRDTETECLNYMLALSAHTWPVLLTYREVDEIDNLVDRELHGHPLYDFTASDGVRHTLWRAHQTDEIVKAFASVPFLYIADGHHRIACTVQLKDEMQGGAAKENEEFHYFLAALFPSNQMNILPYNRYVSDLGSMTDQEFLNTLGGSFEVMPSAGSKPDEKDAIGMYLGGAWYTVRSNNHVGSCEKYSFAVHGPHLFSQNLLARVLGIEDQRVDDRVEFIGGVDSVASIERHVDRKGGVGFTFSPVSVDELLTIAENGDIMPFKSTWFSPKLQSGLLIHRF